MKSIIKNTKNWRVAGLYFIICLFILNSNAIAQDDSSTVTKEEKAVKKAKPSKNTFQSVWIGDNQTVMVPVKGTMEMDIMHRFGVINNGYKDFWGFFAPSNIRLGINYAPIKNLFVGIGITKGNMLVDGNAKYSIIRQTKGKYPVSVSYYTNIAFDTRKDEDKSLFKYSTQRISFFNQLIIARKVTNKLSVQLAPSISHQNAVDGYYTKNDSTGTAIFKYMKNDHFAVAFSARYKITTVTSVMINYDQPITKHATNNPDPNLSFGVEFNTSSHSFQLFVGNYAYINPQRNNLFNTNAPFSYTDKTMTHPNLKSDGTTVKGGRFVIGFNITRLWNY